jgi:hypothetical protein
MKIGVMGGGFGIYGYLPAIILGGNTPVTLEKYRTVILQRSDVQQFDDQIQYVSNLEKLVEESTDALVLAVPPLVRREILESFLSPYPGHLFLEKPIASSSEEYWNLTEKLGRVANTWSVGYLFPYTEWHRELQSCVAEPSDALEITIHWTLPKPESRDNWKVDKIFGGGIINFYLSHFIPFLRQNNFDASSFSAGANGDVIWNIGKNGPKGYRLTVQCGYGERFFSVSTTQRDRRACADSIYRHETPFGFAPQSELIDARSAMVHEYMREVFNNPQRMMQNQVGEAKAIEALREGHSIDCFH